MLSNIAAIVVGVMFLKKFYKQLDFTKLFPKKEVKQQ